MSLIQAALDKTQSRISAQTVIEKAVLLNEGNGTELNGLGTFDREIEKKIAEIQNKFEPKKTQTAKKNRIILFVGLGFAFLAGIIYWLPRHSWAEALSSVFGRVVASSFSQSKNLSMTSNSSGSQARFNLSGIAWGGNQPYALINGHVFRVGDTIEPNATVQSIEREYVIVVFRGIAMRLILKR